MQSFSGGSQENGITATNTSPTNPNFVPAQENKEYIPSEWALTTTEMGEIVREPPPENRRRIRGHPAFLRPTPISNDLAAALTILHSIPRARTALLCKDYSQSDYGHNPTWWNGDKITISRVIDVDNEREKFEEAAEEIAEVQRLMAFLDCTDRAYGSIAPLSDMRRVQEYPSGKPSKSLY